MKDSKYLHNYPRFSPFLDFYKKLHYNPKIYKLAKLFSKNKINYVQPEEKIKASSLPRPKIVKKSENLPEELQSKIPHLPKLPVLEEPKSVHAYEFHSLRLANNKKFHQELKKTDRPTVLHSRKGSETISKGTVLTFNFTPLLEARTTSIPSMPLRSEDQVHKAKEEIEKISEKIKRKIIYSKRKLSVNLKDFSSFFDYQDGQLPLYSSFSNQ